MPVPARRPPDIIALVRSAFAAGAVLWAASLPVAAFVAGHAHGIVAYTVTAAAYAAGSVVCHQRPDRSFHLWQAQLPVCARCAGIYAGAAIVATLSALVPLTHDTSTVARKGLDPGSARIVLLAAAIPTAVTLVYEWTSGQVPGNWIRAASGLPLGAAAAWIAIVRPLLGARDVR